MSAIRLMWAKKFRELFDDVLKSNEEINEWVEFWWEVDQKNPD